MSRSHHVTRKDLKGFSKKEIDEMANDKDSVLHQYSEKSKLKKEILKRRKEEKKK